jgi:hypothetical protein
MELVVGQAAVDLPDPLDTSSARAPRTRADADDLLSQLAGEEVDRMLASAGETPTSSPSGVEVAAPRPSPVESDDIVDGAIVGEKPPVAKIAIPQATIVTPKEPQHVVARKASPFADAAPVVVTPDVPAGSIDEALAKQASALVQVGKQENSPEPGAAPAAPDAGDSAVAVAAELDADHKQNVVKLSELASAAKPDAVAPSPIYYRPLIWANAPFAALPDPLRDALGKVAILTLLNSLAVIAYVLLLRGR